MKTLIVLLFLSLYCSWTESRVIEFINKCSQEIWVEPLTNAQGPVLQPGIVRLRNSEHHTYLIPDGGWYVIHLIL